MVLGFSFPAVASGKQGGGKFPRASPHAVTLTDSWMRIPVFISRPSPAGHTFSVLRLEKYRRVLLKTFRMCRVFVY